MKKGIKRLAVFVSGSGSNFEAIEREIRKGKIKGNIVLLISSRDNVGALKRAKKFSIDAYVLKEKEFNTVSDYVEKMRSLLQKYNVDYILLAGFLRKVPSEIVEEYKNRILNIHPALLPKYGGKGMYGLNVHKAVIDNKEKVTGVTIHFIDVEYDRGRIIVQKKVRVKKNDTPETLQKRVLQVEHKIYPKVVAKLCKGKLH